MSIQNERNLTRSMVQASGNQPKKMKNLYTTSLLLIFITSCQTPRKPYQLYGMDEFKIAPANEFVQRIEFLPAIHEISIVDTKADGNDFIVNRQHIFLDTTQQDQPNYYSYKKRARELSVNEDSLLNCLKIFYQAGVNDFSRDNNHYRFRVVVGLTVGRGYLYSTLENLHSSDTLPATSVRNTSYHFNVVLDKQVDRFWFQYHETL